MRSSVKSCSGSFQNLKEKVTDNKIRIICTCHEKQASINNMKVTVVKIIVELPSKSLAYELISRGNNTVPLADTRSHNSDLFG